MSDAKPLVVVVVDAAAAAVAATAAAAAAAPLLHFRGYIWPCQYVFALFDCREKRKARERKCILGSMNRDIWMT